MFRVAVSLSNSGSRGSLRSSMESSPQAAFKKPSKKKFEDPKYEMNRRIKDFVRSTVNNNSSMQWLEPICAGKLRYLEQKQKE